MESTKHDHKAPVVFFFILHLSLRSARTVKASQVRMGYENKQHSVEGFQLIHVILPKKKLLQTDSAQCMPAYVTAENAWNPFI